MDIQLTEEQEQLQLSIQRLLRDQYDFNARRKIADTDEGWSRKHWNAFAELGLCAVPFKESSGGLGGGPLATMIIMQEIGRKLVLEPFLETVVLAGGIIEDIGSPAQRETFLPQIMSGETIWALGWAEGRGRYDLANVVTTARRQGEIYTLSGAKAVVIGLVVLACTAASACLEVLIEEHLPARSAVMGNYFMRQLNELMDQYPDYIADVRGKGLLLGLEFSSRELREAVQVELFHRGVLVAATLNANRTIRIEPPLIITESQINLMIETLESILVDLTPKGKWRKDKGKNKKKKAK